MKKTKPEKNSKLIYINNRRARWSNLEEYFTRLTEGGIVAQVTIKQNKNSFTISDSQYKQK